MNWERSRSFFLVLSPLILSLPGQMSHSESKKKPKLMVLFVRMKKCHSDSDGAFAATVHKRSQ